MLYISRNDVLYDCILGCEYAEMEFIVIGSDFNKRWSEISESFERFFY